MRKLVALICFTAFFALQYGKLISYWHCRIESADSNSTLPCDCEKIFADARTIHDNHSPAPSVSKDKSEEIFLIHKMSDVNKVTITIPGNIFPEYTSLMPEGYKNAVFLPPRL